MTADTRTTRRTRLPLLREWYWKMLYVIGSAAIYYLGGGLAPTSVSRGILRSLLVFVLVLLAARVFRGPDEPGRESRAWWRMTSRPLSGVVLGVLSALVTIALSLYAYGVETVRQEASFRSQEPYVVITAIVFAALAVLYLTSSIRLRTIARDARLEAERGAARRPSSPRD